MALMVTMAPMATMVTVAVGHRRDSPSDAKVMGCGDNWSDNGSEPSTRACHAKKLEHNSEIQKSAMGEHEKLDGERADGLLCKTADGDTWRELAANGVQWRRVDGFDGDDGFDGSMASMAAMVAQERADVQVPLCPCRDECTQRSSLLDGQHATSCFRCSVMMVSIVTVFTMAVLGVQKKEKRLPRGASQRRHQPAQYFCSARLTRSRS